MSIGFQVRSRQRCVSDENAQRAKNFPVANISDCMSRMFAGGPQLRPIHEGGKVLAGPALTVRCRPGDNLMVHHALDIAKPGDVIVVDAAGDLTTAIMGEIMAAVALKNGVAGMVINGAIRDASEIRRMGLILYAAGITHRGPYKDGPGEINTPIAFDGMVVEPGDLVLGDDDGVLSIPYDDIDDVLAAAARKKVAEEEELEAIANGTVDRSWVAKALKEKGCLQVG